MMDSLIEYEHADTISMTSSGFEENLQKESQSEILQHISRWNDLSKKHINIHTSLLYYRHKTSKLGTACYEAWKSLIKAIEGTSNIWRDLGKRLGLTEDDLNYVQSVKDDLGNTVLKKISKNETATLGEILNAFVEMSHYDILYAIEEPFYNLAQCFNKHDSGYLSNKTKDSMKEVICLKDLPYHLSPALNNEYAIKEIESNRPKQPLIGPVMNPIGNTIKKDSPILFLTFAEDGLQTAYNIQYKVSNWTDITGVTVLTLNDRKEEVYPNPDKFIRDHFEKADYIVPILTDGYFNEIVSHNTNSSNTHDNLDFKYVQFIYNLMVNHYIHVSGCLNKKFRSVLPKDAGIDLCKRFDIYPVLLPWTNEDNFDEYFQVFFKKDG